MLHITSLMQNYVADTFKRSGSMKYANPTAHIMDAVFGSETENDSEISTRMNITFGAMEDGFDRATAAVDRISSAVKGYDESIAFMSSAGGAL